MKIWGVVVAAGAGRRMGSTVAKQFLKLGGEPVVVHALRAFARWSRLTGLVITVPAADIPLVVDEILPKIQGLPPVKVVAGGAERQDSVRNGLEALTGAAPEDVVLIHDGVRPFLPVERLDALVEAAFPDGALLAVSARDTVKRVDEGRVVKTLDRSSLALAQTPQAFPHGLICMAHRDAAAKGLAATDDIALVEALGLSPRVVEGDPMNIKVTTPEDMMIGEGLLSRGMSAGLRVGQGYDAHRLVEGRPLIIGGVNIPYDLGLLGHSDADVLAHAIADACLGAAKLGDIGRHFPDTDPRFKGADSMKLLTAVAMLIGECGGRILNVDATLLAQRPKIAAHIPAMEANIASALALEPAKVNVKATTTEGMGFVGTGEGMAAQAVALLAFS